MLGDSEDDSVATDMIQKLKRIIADKDQTIAHLAESLTQKEGQVREMDKSIAEKSTGMLALSREVAEKNGKIEEILAELSDLKEVLAKKDERCCAQIHEHILEYVRTAGEEDEQKICRTREDVVRKNGKLEELLKKFSSELHELSACIAKKNRQIEEMHQTIEELQIRLSHLETEYVAKRKLNNAKKLRELQNLSTVSVEIEESINKLRRETASIADCNKRDNCRTCETVNSITSATYRPPTSCASSTEISSLSQMAWSERVRKTLAEMLVAKTVAVEMYQRDALSVDELKSVHTCKNSSAAAHVLLKILMQQPTNDASMFECFLECLKSTQQQKVYEWITSPAANAGDTLTPTLTHIINPLDQRRVVGLTSVGTRLFVLLHPGLQSILEFETITFKLCQWMVQVQGLSDCDCNGLTSCIVNRCLFVSDSLKDVVFKVELHDNKVSSWTVDRGPEGLSVNAACNLLVACHKASVIQEYTKNGRLVRRIALEVNDIRMFPYHAVQLTSGQYVVGYSDGNLLRPVYGVSEVDEQGRIVFCYAEKLAEPKFSWPNRLAVDKSNIYILVADTNNHRILILNRLLRCIRELNLSRDSELCQPSCLCFDESHDRLFVSEFDDITRRIFVFDSVISTP